AAILAKGQLRASGTIPELTSATDATSAGWEVVVSGLTAAAADNVRARVRKLTNIAGDRYRIEIDGAVRPEPLIAELAGAGAALICVSPVRTTLEDVFVKHVGES